MLYTGGVRTLSVLTVLLLVAAPALADPSLEGRYRLEVNYVTYAPYATSPLRARAVLRVEENGSGDLGLAPLQVRALSQGVLFEPMHQVYCNDDGFGIRVDASNLSSLEIKPDGATTYKVVAELYVEAMFQTPGGAS